MKNALAAAVAVTYTALALAEKLGLSVKPFRLDGKGPVDPSRVCVRAAPEHAATLVAFAKALNLAPLKLDGYAHDSDGVVQGSTGHYSWIYFDRAAFDAASCEESSAPALPADYKTAAQSKPTPKPVFGEGFTDISNSVALVSAIQKLEKEITEKQAKLALLKGLLPKQS